MSKKLVTFHLTTLSMWAMGNGKGRISIYAPLKGFSDKGHEVYYITSRGEGDEEDRNGIKYRHVNAPNFGRLKGIFRIFNFVVYILLTVQFFIKVFILSIKKKPDVIYAHTSHLALVAFLLSKIFNTKYVLRLYGVGDLKPHSALMKKTKCFHLLIALKLDADAFILTNDGTKAKELADYYGVPVNKIHFLKNGINKSWINSFEKNELKESHTNNKVILSVSRLIASKQIDIIIKMMPKLVKLNKQVKLIIVGDGAEKEKLIKLSKDLKVSKYILFTGGVKHSQIVHYMKACNVFISMNALSSMSNPVFEAMICRKSVVALNKGNTEELIKNNYNGILIEQDNIDQLANVVNDLLVDDNKMLRIGNNASQYLVDNWPSWKERVNYEVDLIESLFNHK